MAKLKTDPISQADLVDFLDNHSDFSFELLVLNKLIDHGFSCEHGGSYEDRATNKAREFDIRARRVEGKKFLRLAVECKNLRSNFPLLVSCVPRREQEAFHEIVYSVDPEKHPLENPPPVYIPAMLAKSKNIRITGQHTFYKAGDRVGKSCHQIGRLAHQGNEILATDSDVYAKWSQALSSADDLTYLACCDGNDRTGDLALSLVFPVLVVPNGQLWLCEYDSDGNRIKDPEPVNRCSYYVNLSYFHAGAAGGDGLAISHLEFVTLDGLVEFITSLIGDEQKLDSSFPVDHVLQKLAEQL
ncbi:MAG: hypothetical protein ACIAZJ_07765 [Gimesia chilikensis]|uniref:hypothetical protein n=1 Tax=Gimesia chilikensis TaxID=2605989 RepID=UPI00379E2004